MAKRKPASKTISLSKGYKPKAPTPPPPTEVTLGEIKNTLNRATDLLITKAADISDGITEISDGMKDGTPVALQRAAIPATDDVSLWVVIRKSTEALKFANYNRFMNAVLCGTPNGVPQADLDVYKALRLSHVRALPFSDTDAYRLLKVATEAFLMVNGGVSEFDGSDADLISRRLGSGPLNKTKIKEHWAAYLGRTTGATDPMLPYLALIREKLGSEEIKNQIFAYESPIKDSPDAGKRCVGLLRDKLQRPLLLELIWNYWIEESMMVQSIGAIARRFQNIHAGPGRDPLANFEVDTLRPLSNILWGYVQDEQHRLSIIRRDQEYKHHYGIFLKGRAVPNIRPADNRSKFIEGFHQLLRLCTLFFRQDDDTTVKADAFPVLNALKEVHLVLSQGAHNQFGDLPSTARQEMLLQQWILARPEFREFLPTRIAVAYPEPWMDRVEAMKTLQGWTDTSVTHFYNLAVFGEQLLLSIRYGNWGSINEPPEAGNWARYWRAEMQGYIHSYRAVTGVDLSATPYVTDQVDSTPPSVHLLNRYMAQERRM